MKKFTVVDARIVVEADDDMDDSVVGGILRSCLMSNPEAGTLIDVVEFEYSHIIMETKDEGPKVSIHEELPDP